MKRKSHLLLIPVKVLTSCYICIITLCLTLRMLRDFLQMQLDLPCVLWANCSTEHLSRQSHSWLTEKNALLEEERKSFPAYPEYVGSGGGKKKRPEESEIDAAEDKFRCCFGLTGSLLTEIRLFFPMCWLKETLSLAVCLVLWSILVC